MQDSLEEQRHFLQSTPRESRRAPLSGATLGAAMATAARRERKAMENFMLAVEGFVGGVSEKKIYV